MEKAHEKITNISAGVAGLGAFEMRVSLMPPFDFFMLIGMPNFFSWWWTLTLSPI